MVIWNWIEIQHFGTNFRKGNLVLKTIDGKVIYSNKHDSNFEINMENLTAGIYFIDIHQSNGEVITFKIQKS
jgi:hypothetical protein